MNIYWIHSRLAIYQMILPCRGPRSLTQLFACYVNYPVQGGAKYGSKKSNISGILVTDKRKDRTRGA